ncbi:MAG: hypothetical protein HRK26_04395 [Rickettsiaceae bacterium H1]|nr:hypothetical protein [Rickettsiaceae bacterium H1]
MLFSYISDNSFIWLSISELELFARNSGISTGVPSNANGFAPASFSKKRYWPLLAFVDFCNFPRTCITLKCFPDLTTGAKFVSFHYLKLR